MKLEKLSLMNLIREYVGIFSQPRDLFQDEADCYWVESHTVVDDPYYKPIKFEITDSLGKKRKIYYTHQYTQMKQNFWGYWIPETCYLGRNYPLTKVVYKVIN